MKSPKPKAFECGCTYTYHAWVTVCERHKAETRELHERAMREYRAAMATAEARRDPLAQ